jgi:hypothetical protein
MVSEACPTNPREEASGLDPEAVHEDVLYMGESDVVNVLTGETPEDLDRSASRAQQFAEEKQSDGKPPRIAKKLPPEQAVESRSPYVSSVFCDRGVTGGMNWHKAFLEAWRSHQYEVTHDADYETGTLEIRVTKI